MVDLTTLFVAGVVVELWDLDVAEGNRKIRTVANSTLVSGLHTRINFVTGDPYIPLTADDTRMLAPSTGINNTISEVQFGAYSPVLLQSGWPHTVLVGATNVVLDGSNTSFSVTLGVRAADADAEVMLQPVGVVSGSPSNTDWTLARVSSFNTLAFVITLPSAVSNATV